MLKKKVTTYISQKDAERTSEIFLQLLDDIPTGWHDMVELAEKAEITAQTLWNWKFGTVCEPRLNTLIKVGTALGYQLKFVPTTKKPHLRVVH